MAAIGKGIFNLLSNNSTLSSNVGTRIMPDVINATASAARVFPYITYDILSVDPQSDKSIAAGGSALVDVFRVQINIYSRKYSELETLAAAVLSTISPERPPQGSAETAPSRRSSKLIFVPSRSANIPTYRP